GGGRRAAAAAAGSNPRESALLLPAAPVIALDRAWFWGPGDAPARVRTAEESSAATDQDPASRWDLDFLVLRMDYFDQILGSGTFRPGPDGKDPVALAGIRRRGSELIGQAPDEVRRGWAEFYLGAIADNLYAEHDAAPGHYLAALRAGEAGDDLLAREALRHLGDHDHDNADHELALDAGSGPLPLAPGPARSLARCPSRCCSRYWPAPPGMRRALERWRARSPGGAARSAPRASRPRPARSWPAPTRPRPGRTRRWRIRRSWGNRCWRIPKVVRRGC